MKEHAHQKKDLEELEHLAAIERAGAEGRQTGSRPGTSTGSFAGSGGSGGSESGLSKHGTRDDAGDLSENGSGSRPSSSEGRSMRNVSKKSAEEAAGLATRKAAWPSHLDVAWDALLQAEKQKEEEMKELLAFQTKGESLNTA